MAYILLKDKKARFNSGGNIKGDKMEHLINKRVKIGILVGFIIAFGGRVFSEEIHEFAMKGNLEGVKAQIVQNPELVNAKDKDGRTPLHWACRGVHLDVVKYLVENGADVNAEDNNKVVPLHSLAVRNSTAAIEILLANEADINAKDYSSHTALHQAAMN
ncbi:MAG: ankyrin repeat domain-containing protein, partial [Candidatus Aminicenantes bacterium]|nr:ankyrin repeat domain-containing protein [Candidatus Aminicenantes bacterium]